MRLLATAPDRRPPLPDPRLLQDEFLYGNHRLGLGPHTCVVPLIRRENSVKQFIRNVRAAKTIADERAVIQKESAAIRASFREESHDHGVRCVARTCSSSRACE